MKHFIDRRIVMATTLAVTILAFMLSSCSSDGDKVKIDARFLNMNQASFYVYSPDGAINGIDTITVNGGRFTYEKEIVQDGTLVLVFPNYAVMPVFRETGGKISRRQRCASEKHGDYRALTTTSVHGMAAEQRQAVAGGDEGPCGTVHKGQPEVHGFNMAGTTILPAEREAGPEEGTGYAENNDGDTDTRGEDKSDRAADGPTLCRDKQVDGSECG